MTKTSILIVEDEIIAAENIRSQLIGLDYEIPEIVVSGKEALRKTEEQRPDLVLMDIRLQGKMDGVDAAEKIRDRFDIPVVYLTAYSDKETLERIRGTEPYGYILKPFKIREMHGTIQVALQRHALEQELQNAHNELEIRVEERTAELRESNEILRREITEHKRTEAALHEAEENYRGIFENAIEGIYRSTPEGKFIIANPALADILGYESPEDLISNVKDIEAELFINARERQELKGIMEMQGIVEGFVCKTRRKDGETIYLMENSHAVRDEDGKLSYYEGMVTDITELVQAQDEVRENEKKYRMLAENVSDVIWTMDQNMDFSYVSPSVERALGYTAEEIIAQGLEGIMMPHSLKNAVDMCTALWEDKEGGQNDLNQMQPLVLESEYNCKDGSTLWGESRLTYLRDEGGNPIGLRGVTRDVTDRKKADEALQRQADELAAINLLGKKVNSQLSPEQLIKGALDELNKSFDIELVLFFQRRGNDLIMQNNVSRDEEFILDEKSAQQVGACLGRLAGSKRKPIYSEEIDCDPTCPLINVHHAGIHTFTAIPMIVDQNILGVLVLGSKNGDTLREHSTFLDALVNNITIGLQNAILYQQVQHQNEFMNDVMSSMTHPFYVINVNDYSIEIANTAAQESGLSVNNTCYALIHDRAAPCEGDNYSCPIKEIKKSKQPLVVEHVHKNRDGNLRNMQIHSFPIFDEGGNVKQIIEYVLDITEQIQTEKMLLRSERLASAGKLAASVAHEIKNPLQSVLGCLGLAEEAVEEGKAADQYFNLAKDAVWRVNGIVNQMRELYRPVAHTRVQFDVNVLLKKVLDLTKTQCDDSGVEVIWQESDNNDPVWMVLDHIHQIFLNLVLNALDAMPDGGKLWVSTTRTEKPPGIKINFSDNGAGIAHKDLPNVFEPFFTTKEQGSGLGLSISFGLVKDHGGWIDVESEPDKGSTFTVWLPNPQR